MLSVSPQQSVSFNRETKNYDGGNRPVRIKEKILTSLKQGQKLHSEKKFDEAIDTYSLAITTIIDSNNPTYNKIQSIALVLRGNVYKEKGENKLALQDHNEGLKINPTAARYIRVY